MPIPLLIRLPAAVLLVIWGARTNRPWTLPTAAMLGLPVLWLVGLAMLAGAFAVSAWGPLRDAARRWTTRATVAHRVGAIQWTWPGGRSFAGRRRWPTVATVARAACVIPKRGMA